MNMRFSTQAANADVLGEDAPAAVTEGLTDDVGADGTPRDPRARPQARSQARPAGEAEAESGKNGNGAGLARDNDAAKP